MGTRTLDLGSLGASKAWSVPVPACRRTGVPKCLLSEPLRVKCQVVCSDPGSNHPLLPPANGCPRPRQIRFLGTVSSRPPDARPHCPPHRSWHPAVSSDSRAHSGSTQQGASAGVREEGCMWGEGAGGSHLPPPGAHPAGLKAHTPQLSPALPQGGGGASCSHCPLPALARSREGGLGALSELSRFFPLPTPLPDTNLISSLFSKQAT